MNKGIRIAKGEIISFLNVDDYYEPGVLERVHTLFNTLPEPSLVVGNCNVWDSEGKLIFVNTPAHLNLEDFLSGKPFPVNPSAYFYHKSLHDTIGLYDETDNYALDLDFLLRAVQAAHVVYIDETWGNYRFFKGTKTYEDMERGTAYARKQDLLRKYRGDLKPSKRFSVVVRFTFLYIFRRLLKFKEKISRKY
jgi:glycosyltransferase involved in cell wall biosynthesis